MKWKQTTQDENYEVSDTGRVRRRTVHKLASRWPVGRELSQQQTKDGYVKVKISGKYVPVARLVVETFVCPRPKGLTINHKDGNKKNNNAKNLEWLTRADNQRHAIAMGLVPVRRGEEHGNAKLTEAAVREIRATPSGTRGLAKKFDVDKSLIRGVRLGQGWKHVKN